MFRLPAVTAFCAALAVTAALAEPAPPWSSDLVDIVDFGIYCRPEVTGTKPAPETTLGFVNLLGGDTTIRHHQQEVPAMLGVSFGVIALPHVSVQDARMETYRPGKTGPDIWYTDLNEGAEKVRGFTFDFEDEAIPGLWRMEAWDDQTRLYSIEFLVVPPASLPGIGSDCNMLS